MRYNEVNGCGPPNGSMGFLRVLTKDRGASHQPTTAPALPARKTMDRGMETGTETMTLARFLLRRHRRAPVDSLRDAGIRTWRSSPMVTATRKSADLWRLGPAACPIHARGWSL